MLLVLVLMTMVVLLLLCCTCGAACVVPCFSVCCDCRGACCVREQPETVEEATYCALVLYHSVRKCKEVVVANINTCKAFTFPDSGVVIVVSCVLCV